MPVPAVLLDDMTKHSFLFLLTAAASIAVATAESTVKLSNVHLCCKACVTGVEKALSKADGVKAEVDKDAGTVTLTAADNAGLEKGVAAMVRGGYYGASSDASIKSPDAGKLPAGKVQSLKVEGVHLCCGKCVTAVDKAVKSVAGVQSHTAEKGSKSFEVTGDFKAADIFAVLNKAGLAGRVGK